MMKLYKKLFFTSILLVVSYSASAVEVIRATITQTTSSSIDIALYDIDAPVTVATFLNNIDTGTFDNIFFNRSITDFVIQAGGYSFDQTVKDGSFSYAGSGVFDGGLQPTPNNNSTIQNEFKRSNLRGTLAMAKPGDSVSSSNEWFINLADDNTYLDTTGEGFTVFGEILDNGMETIDQIASIPTFDLTADIALGSASSDVALVDFMIGSNTSAINDSNLVKIDFYRLVNFTDILDFDPASTPPIQKDIVISNTSSQALDLGSFDTSSITPPFSVENDGCSLTTLGVNGQCTITILFTPITEDYFVSTGTMEIDGAIAIKGTMDIAPFNRTLSIELRAPGPDIHIAKENIDFGFQPVYTSEQGQPETAVIYINNYGDRDLVMSSIQFNSSTPGDFIFIDNCMRDNNAYEAGKIPPQGLCVLVLNFIPTDLLVKTATITILSDDPDEPELTINITGGSNTDYDGIDSNIEDAAPNNGDGNFDGNPDRLQNNVVSFPGAYGVYTTLLADEGMSFSKVKALQTYNLSSLPDGVSLENGAFTFELTGFPAGSIVKLGMILPVGNTPNDIYSYGPTANDTTPHWYTLVKNTSPGVFMFGNVSLINASSAAVQKNITTLYIQDGGDGDSDQLINGKILFVGGPEMTIGKTDDSSGGILWLALLLPLSLVFFRRL